MQANPTPIHEADEWDRKAARIHANPRRKDTTTDPVEVAVTGIHLTFDNVLTLVLMVVLAQLAIGVILGVIVGIILASFDVI